MTHDPHTTCRNTLSCQGSRGCGVQVLIAVHALSTFFLPKYLPNLPGAIKLSAIVAAVLVATVLDVPMAASNYMQYLRNVRPLLARTALRCWLRVWCGHGCQQQGLCLVTCAQLQAKVSGGPADCKRMQPSTRSVKNVWLLQGQSMSW